MINNPSVSGSVFPSASTSKVNSSAKTGGVNIASARHATTRDLERLVTAFQPYFNSYVVWNFLSNIYVPTSIKRSLGGTKAIIAPNRNAVEEQLLPNIINKIEIYH